MWITEHDEDYRAVATQELRKEDCFLELGCAGGVTTILAGKRCKFAVGVDKNESPQVIGTQRRLAVEVSGRNVSFACFDCLDVRPILHLDSEMREKAASFTGFTVLFVDLSESCGTGVLLELVERLEVSLPSLRLICFKSHRLVCLADRIHRPGHHHKDPVDNDTPQTDATMKPRWREIVCAFAIGVAVGAQAVGALATRV